jgi:hypothetical protein
MWQLLAQLLHRTPKVPGPYNPPLSAQVDRFDIFGDDPNVYEHATMIRPDLTGSDWTGQYGAL